MTDAGYDDWLDAIEEGIGYFIECENGHGALPPRRVCPHCGSPNLEEKPLAEVGEIQTFTVIHIGTPDYTNEQPYVTAIAAFGPVRVTGVIKGMDPSAVDVGLPVEASVGANETTGDRRLVLRPR